MLHDHIGTPKKELDDFLSDPGDHFILSGGIWRHKHRFHIDSGVLIKSVSIVFDKYFTEAFKEYVQSKSPKNGAFAKKTIFQLLEAHSKNKFVMTIDMRQYFENISFDLVSEAIAASPELSPYAKQIEKVYFSDQSLRRGLMCSPAISEIVGMRIDDIVGRVIHESKISAVTYSRYYDDLVFSANARKDLEILLPALSSSIKASLSLELNNKKTKIKILQGSRILGLRFDKGELIVPKEFKKKLRACEYRYKYIGEYDLDEVWSKLGLVGTIIGSYHRIIGSSSIATSGYKQSLEFYYKELARLQELRDKYLMEKYNSS